MTSWEIVHLICDTLNLCFAVYFVVRLIQFGRTMRKASEIIRELRERNEMLSDLAASKMAGQFAEGLGRALGSTFTVGRPRRRSDHNADWGDTLEKGTIDGR